MGIDQQLRDDLFLGAEISRRDADIPQGPITVNAEELFGRAYVYWAPRDWLALNAEYQFDYGEIKLDPTEKNTIHRVPLEARIYHPSGLFGRLRGTYVKQEVQFLDFASGARATDNDSWFSMRLWVIVSPAPGR